MGLVNANLIPELINLSNKFITTPCTSITFSSVRWHDHMCITIASAAADRVYRTHKIIEANIMPTNKKPLKTKLIGLHNR
jgi:hypothetical protein